MHLTEAEDIKKRWQEYTEELHTKKDLNNPDNHDGVITHLEPDILECEIKWVLGSITMNKASGGDGIPASNASLTIQNQKNLALFSCGCLIPSLFLLPLLLVSNPKISLSRQKPRSISPVSF